MKMSSKTTTTPIKTVGKRKDVPQTPTSNSSAETTASPYSPNKSRKQAPIGLTIFYHNLVAIAVVASHAFLL